MDSRAASRSPYFGHLFLLQVTATSHTSTFRLVCVSPNEKMDHVFLLHDFTFYSTLYFTLLYFFRLLILIIILNVHDVKACYSVLLIAVKELKYRI